MTGRDLMIYILQNNLEDFEFFKDGDVPGLMSIHAAAVKFEVGIGTIRLWYAQGVLAGVTFGDQIYIYNSETDPRLKKEIREVINVWTSY